MALWVPYPEYQASTIYYSYRKYVKYKRKQLAIP